MKVELSASFSVLVSVPLLLLQLLTLPLFLTVREFRTRICFRIMFCLGIADSLQLLIGILFSLFVLLDFNSGENFERLCGAFMQLAWDLVIFHHFLLAANRLLVFVKASFMPSVLKKEPKAEQTLFMSLLALIWALFLALLVAFQTPNLGVRFVADQNTFYPDLSLPWMRPFLRFEFYWSCVLLPTIAIAYLSIVFLLKKFRKKSSNVPSAKAANKSPLNRQEWRILGQSVAMFVMMGALVTVWNLIDIFDLTPPDGVMFFNLFLYLVCCGINPILYLCTLPEFRLHFSRLFCACFAIDEPSPIAAAAGGRGAFQSAVNVSTSVVTVVGQRSGGSKMNNSQSMANGGRTMLANSNRMGRGSISWRE